MPDDELDEFGYRLRPYPDQMRIYLDALRVVLDQTGPKGEPPGFAAAIAAGERWTDTEIRKQWIALETAIDAYPGDSFSPPAQRWGKTNHVWIRMNGPLERATKLLVDIWTRWRAPDMSGSTRVYIRGGKWMLAGGEEWIPVVAPILEPGECQILTWAHYALEDALAHVPPDEPGEPLSADSATSAEVDSNTPEWGEWIPCSLNVLFKGTRFGKYTKEKLDMMTKPGGELQVEKLDADEPRPRGNWDYRAKVRNEERRGWLRVYVKTMTESDPPAPRPRTSSRISTRTFHNRPLAYFCDCPTQMEA